MTRVLGLVPVLLDDLDAPHGCSALRRLRDVPLLCLAVQALVASGVVQEVLVPAPAAILGAVQALGAELGPARLVPVPEPGCRELLATVGSGLLLGAAALGPDVAADDHLVVVHDPRCGQAPPDLVRSVVRELSADPAGDAVVPVRELTDTVKWVASDGRVLDTPDRTAFRVLSTPQAYRAATLAEALHGAADGGARGSGPEVLPARLRAAGFQVRGVPSGWHVPWLADPTDLLLAETVPRTAS